MAYLRDRRAFGNIGTRKFRGARFGDALSPRFSGLLDQYGGAAAAYSLRALSSGWVAGDVIEVRPSSGWTPASFTAGQVANGEMVDYVKRPGNFTNVALNPFEEFTNNGEGDGFTAKDTTSAGFVSAYVVSGAASDVVTVSFDLVIVSGSPSVSLRDAQNQTRSNIEVISTNGSHSIVLTATGNFNNFSIADGDVPSEFTVSNVRFSTADAFVSTWYDQSGNANNLLQATEAQQRKIVNTGALVTDEGEPAIDGNIYGMQFTSTVSLTGAFSILCLGQLGLGGQAILGSPTLSSPRIRTAAAEGLELVNNANGEINFTGLDTSPTFHSFDGTRILMAIYRDGSDSVDMTIAGQVAASGPLTLSGTFGFTNALSRNTDINPVTGKFQELIIWPSDIR
jgi:hypothetical protein